MSTRDATWSFVDEVNPSAPPLEDNNYLRVTPVISSQSPTPYSPVYPDLECFRATPEPLAYSNQSIRAGFVRKVFGIVAIMILIVTVECAVAMMQPQVSNWMQSDRGLNVLAGSGGIFFLLFAALVLIEGLRRTSPLNLLIVFAMAAALGYPIAFLCTKYNVESILLCVVLLTQSCLALSLLACDPNFNIVRMIRIVFSPFCRLACSNYDRVCRMERARSTGIAKMITAYIMLSSFVSTFYLLTWPHATWWNIYYAILGCTLTMTYLVIDVQLLMDDSDRYLSAEEYVFASVQIFLDVLNIFVYIIRIFGTKREKD